MLEIDVDGLSGLLSGLLINYSSIKKKIVEVVLDQRKPPPRHQPTVARAR
jgi:hypothetical protein